MRSARREIGNKLPLMVVLCTDLTYPTNAPDLGVLVACGTGLGDFPLSSPHP